MLQAVRPNQNRQAVSEVVSLPSPIGGLNARDPLAKMGTTDALILDNFFPKINSVKMRRGHSSHATGCGSSFVQSLLVYHALSGSEKLFAGANGNIYDATAAGSVTSAYSTSITVNKWQWINFSNSAGLWLLAVNGTDTPLKYSGSAWSTNLLPGSITSSAKTCINIFQFKERVWLVEKNTLNLWYLASQAISGTPTKLPLGGVFTKGGSIVAGGAFSINDSGDGMDDLLVAVSSQGEAVIYSGTNPATDFLLIGVYDVGEPLGYRCLQKVNGDLYVITKDGMISMRQAINYDRSKDELTAVTAKIAPTFNEQARNYGANFGWEAALYHNGPYVVVNVPVAEGIRQIQYVQNVITGAWCRFTGMNANCWAEASGLLYFGGNAGVVYKADTGNTDNGAQIEAEMKTAFISCGSPGQNKLFTTIRPLLITSGTGAINIGIDVDFQNVQPTASISATPGTVGIWGTGTWGNAKWGGGALLRKWVTATKFGTFVAAHLRCASLGTSIEVNGFDMLYQKSKGTVF